MKNEFFGTKLNTALLLILIVLMIIAIKIMWNDKDKYLHPFSQNEEQVKGDEGSFGTITGNKDDLVFLSVLPGQKISGVLKLTGSLKNAYFFEGNIRVSVLDMNKKVLVAGHGTAEGEWMTTLPVKFESTLDLTKLPKGPAYILIQNDNPSDVRENDKSIFVPIVIE